MIWLGQRGGRTADPQQADLPGTVQPRQARGPKQEQPSRSGKGIHCHLRSWVLCRDPPKHISSMNPQMALREWMGKLMLREVKSLA